MRVRDGARRRPRALAWPHLLALALLVVAGLAKGMGPVKAAYLAGAAIEIATIIECDQIGEHEPAGSSETGAPICLNAGHGVPLAAGYVIAVPRVEARLIHRTAQSPRPVSWSSHPPHRPPRLAV